MTFRTKITVLVAVVTVVATALVAVLAVRVTAGELNRETERNLVRLAESPAWFGGPGGGQLGGLLRGLGLSAEELDSADAPSPVLAQVETESGTEAVLIGSTAITVPDDVLQASEGRRDYEFFDADVEGEPYRAVVSQVRAQTWLVVALSTAEQQRILAGLAGTIAFVGLGVALLAALGGWFAAGALVRPLRDLTGAAESVAQTGDLGVAVRTESRDEAGRLSRSFDDMLGALATSQEAQRQLVQDAGHELRTPISSIQANAEVLQRHPELDQSTRAQISEALISESHELTTLVNSLVDLAGVVDDSEQPEVFAASEVVASAVTALGTVDADRVRIDGEAQLWARRSQVRRALVNLLTNAVKFGPENEPIEVTVAASPGDGAQRQSRICVRDHGPGVPERDQPHVFARFWRADAARSAPGSGLGLAIVDDAMRRNGGSANVANHADGGAVFCLRLPAATGTSNG